MIIRRVVAVIGYLILASAAQAADRPRGVTFFNSVLPVVQQRCQECHRPGEIGPFSMMTYEEIRPWAKAIRQAVLTRKMPPWFADAPHDMFLNDRRLSQQEIDTVVTWVDNGAPEGLPEDAPKPISFSDGWRIGQPDTVLELPEYYVPASGEIAYQFISVPSGFTEDKWVQAVEPRPGNPAVVHHIRVLAREPGSKAFMNQTPETSEQRQQAKSHPKDDGSGFLDGPEVGAEEMGAFVPGGDPVLLEPGQAILVKAGSDLVFEVHYTTNGKPQMDRSRVGLIFAKKPPDTRVMEIALANYNFRIPAGAANHRVDSRVTLRQDMTLLSLWPHMHLRGKALELRAIYPSGESEVLLNVPRYDFNWQMSYVLRQPRLLPKGTRLESAVYFDNSPNNPNNPNPGVDVYWGDQTWEEMNIAFMRVGLPPGVSPVDVRVPPLTPPDATGQRTVDATSRKEEQKPE
jgi:mono/diheme cytochrome c family protein